MRITDLEEKIENGLTWKSVAKCLNFPFEDFDELRKSLAHGDGYITVNSITARQWAPVFREAWGHS
jgi:hypothetical protein